jgi:hypothetical protein
MVKFVLQTVALLPIFGIAIGVMFRASLKRHILPKIRSFIHADAK